MSGPHYYTITVKCRFCQCPCPWAVVAEIEPPPAAKITIRCPSHGGPLPISFANFKKVEKLPPGVPVTHYPPRPEPPPTPYLVPKPRWWQFWKRPDELEA